MTYDLETAFIKRRRRRRRGGRRRRRRRRSVVDVFIEHACGNME